MAKVKECIAEDISTPSRFFILKKDGVDDVLDDKPVVDYIGQYESSQIYFSYFPSILIRIRFTKAVDKIEEFSEALIDDAPRKTLAEFSKEIRKKYDLRKNELKFIPSQIDEHLPNGHYLDRTLITFWKRKMFILEFESNKNIDGKCSLI